MKNKLTPKLLLPILLLIWGGVIYQVRHQLKKKPDFDFEIKPRFQGNANKEKVETFSLLQDYKDPFLGTTYRSSDQRSVKKTTPESTAKKTNTPATKIIYKGFSQNKQDRGKHALIEINNQKITIKQGERLEDIYFLKIEKDSLIVLENGKQRVIKKGF